jgi:hypothetical protein
VLFLPGALDAMLALGWKYDAANAEELLVKEGTYFSMKEVRCAPCNQLPASRD